MAALSFAAVSATVMPLQAAAAAARLPPPPRGSSSSCTFTGPMLRADMNEPICDLSGGQKRRLALMLILLEEPNVLILDEPGNDLDVDMLAAVEDLLDGWPGTLLLVTHDRYLMERVTDNQYAILDGHVRHLPGGIDEYLELSAQSELDAQVGAKPASADSASQTAGTSGAASLSNSERRALQKTLLSTERKMETMRSRIADAHARLSEADPTDYIALGEIQGEITNLEAQLENLEMIWLEASEELGE